MHAFFKQPSTIIIKTKPPNKLITPITTVITASNPKFMVVAVVF